MFNAVSDGGTVPLLRAATQRRREAVSGGKPGWKKINIEIPIGCLTKHDRSPECLYNQ